MRMIFEDNVEREDFLEIIINQEELEQIIAGFVSAEFIEGILGRVLNVAIRLDREED